MAGVKGRSGRKPEGDRVHCKNVMRRALTDESVMAVIRTVAKRAQGGSASHAKLLLSYMFGQPHVQNDPLDGLTPEEAKQLVDFKTRMATLELDTMLKLLKSDDKIEFYEPEAMRSGPCPEISSDPGKPEGGASS